MSAEDAKTRPQGSNDQRSIRANLAAGAGRLAGRLSRLTGHGAGGMVGGRVALKIEPNLMEEFSKGRQVVLVTGTNGKSTTTKMTAQALATLGPVAANLGGDNMTNGIMTALLESPDAPYAVLEVDEMHLPQIVAATNPKAIILLNLSRDQLDRVGEIGAVEARLREAVSLAPEAAIIANCDDPLVASAAWDAPNVQWVSAGTAWHSDSTTFPRTGTQVVRGDDHWTVVGTDEYSRPAPDWTFDPLDPDEGETFRITGPNGQAFDVRLQLPGRANRGNATQAAAAANWLGVKPEALSQSLGEVSGVAGRYQTYDVDGRQARLLLAKNPAGWQEALTMIPADAEQVIISVNGQVPDGEDLSWLWDVDFSRISQIAPKTVIASGERSADLAVRLAYAGVECDRIPSPLEAIKAMEPGAVEVLANYTSFRDLKKEIES